MSLIPKKGTVYVVDDDEAVRDSLQWLLEGKDYRVKCFDSSESFLSRFDPREVACLIADIRMEGMSGLELQDRLVERAIPDPIHERLDDLEVDVGFEQRQAYLTQGRLDCGLGKTSFSTNGAEDVLQAATKRVEHHGVTAQARRGGHH